MMQEQEDQNEEEEQKILMEVEDGNLDLIILLGFDQDIHQNDEKYQKDESVARVDVSQMFNQTQKSK